MYFFLNEHDPFSHVGEGELFDVVFFGPDDFFVF